MPSVKEAYLYAVHKKNQIHKKFYVWKNILALSWLVRSTGCTEWWTLFSAVNITVKQSSQKKKKKERKYLEALPKTFTSARGISESNTSEHSWGSGQHRECQNKWAKSQGAIRLQMWHLEQRYIKNLQENHTQPWQQVGIFHLSFLFMFTFFTERYHFHFQNIIKYDQ